MKIAFLGTPEFAIPSLDALVKSKHSVVCVVAQPDRQSGRGGGIIYSPVKQYAIANKLPLFQPDRISNSIEEIFASGKIPKPDIIVTCAFGQILRQNVIDFCKFGVVNVHASLLPAYRGSSPVQWAIINGEKKTGITIMQTDIGLDTGDIISQYPTDIGLCETAGELLGRLSKLGATALVETLDNIESGKVKRTPQNCALATKFPMLEKESGRIHWKSTAGEIVNLVRGVNPWPVAYFHSGNINVRVYKATAVSLDAVTEFNKMAAEQGGGAVVHASAKHGLFVKCRDSVLRIDVLQIPGGKVMNAKDFLNGRTFATGTVFE